MSAWSCRAVVSFATCPLGRALDLVISEAYTGISAHILESCHTMCCQPIPIFNYYTKHVLNVCLKRFLCVDRDHVGFSWFYIFLRLLLVVNINMLRFCQVLTYLNFKAAWRKLHLNEALYKIFLYYYYFLLFQKTYEKKCKFSYFKIPTHFHYRKSPRKTNVYDNFPKKPCEEKPDPFNNAPEDVNAKNDEMCASARMVPGWCGGVPELNTECRPEARTTVVKTQQPVKCPSTEISKGMWTLVGSS